MPRRYFVYDPKYTVYHQLSTVGAMVLGVALFVMLFNLLHGIVRGRRAPANPWGAATLEWRCSSPPPEHNFASPPPVGDPYDMRSMVWDAAEGTWVHDPTRATDPHHAPAEVTSR
jgi:cytochrome c oxidase subunit 1